MAKQYGNSIRFRLLKWLQPMLMTVCLGLCWNAIYLNRYEIGMSQMPQMVLLVVYLLVLYNLEKTYHALAVGLVPVSEMVYSQVLAAAICDVFFYTAYSLYCNTFLIVWPMLIIYCIQFALSTVWSLGVNRIYYANYPSPDTAIVYWNEDDLKRVRMIRYFDEHFNVTKMIDKPSENGNELFEQLEDVQVVFVSGLTAGMRNDIAKYCVLKGKKAYFIPKLGDIVMAGAEYMSMFSEPVTKVQRTQLKTEYLGIKRLMDIVVSLIGLIMVSPIIAATAIAIKVEDGGPVFYRQKRLTLNGRVFSILKFRSMNTNAEKDGVARLASENDKRITRVGKWIRATRIDELPQLINILKGDMSLVGPRPERPEIASEYEKVLPEFRMRLQVKAGLTGMAQVYGRYNTEPYSKLQMDLMYINKLSLETDIKLLFATVKILFMKESTEGIQAGHTTALNDEGDKDNSQMSA